ncbi:hypothetical protein GEMRC1_007183 [Eukaryota sp. GEM-RC1]
MSRTHQQLAAQYKNFALSNIKNAVFLDTLGNAASNVVQTIKCSLNDSLVVIKIRFFRGEDIESIKRRQEYLLSFCNIFNSPESHPNILSFHQIVLQEPDSASSKTHNPGRLYRLYMIRPYIASTLPAVLKTPFAATLTERFWLAYQVSSALAYIHSQSCISGSFYHGHLRPENVLVTKTYWAVISDCGAKPIRINTNDHLQFHRFFDTGVGVYVAPERVLEADELSTEKADVFSLGILLIDILTMSSSQSLSPLIDIVDLKKYENIEETVKSTARSRLLDCGVSDPFIQLVTSCLSLDWTSRPTAQTIVEHLDELFPCFPILHENLKPVVSSNLDEYADILIKLYYSTQSKDLNFCQLLITCLLPLISWSSDIAFECRLSILEVVSSIINEFPLPFDFLCCRVVSELITSLSQSINSDSLSDSEVPKFKSVIVQALSISLNNLIKFPDFKLSLFLSVTCRFVMTSLVSLCSKLTNNLNNLANLSSKISTESCVFLFQCLIDCVDALLIVIDKEVSSFHENPDLVREIDCTRTLVYDYIKKFFNFGYCSSSKISQSFDFLLNSLLDKKCISILSKFFFLPHKCFSSLFDHLEFFAIFISSLTTFEQSDLFSVRTRSSFLAAVSTVFNELFKQFKFSFDTVKMVLNTFLMFLHDFEINCTTVAFFFFKS